MLGKVSNPCCTNLVIQVQDILPSPSDAKSDQRRQSNVGRSVGLAGSIYPFCLLRSGTTEHFQESNFAMIHPPRLGSISA